MNTKSSVRLAKAVCHLLSCACILLIGACGSTGSRSSGASITCLDGSTIDTTALAQQIEQLTRSANVHGLTVTIFNDAPLEWENYMSYAGTPASTR